MNTTALCLAILSLSAYLYHRYKDEWVIHRFKTQLQLNEHCVSLHNLYQGIDGFSLSKLARQTENAIDYTYGEIDIVSFIALLSLDKPNETTIFYDLGSGVGKAVLACAMVYPVAKSVGIELFQELHTVSNEQLIQLASMSQYDNKAERIEFILGDFLQKDFTDATYIYINSTTIIAETWMALNTIIDTLPNLCTVITTSKPLTASTFEVIRKTYVAMSFGVVNAYLHKKIRGTNP